MEKKWSIPSKDEETIGRQGKRIVELEEEVAKLKYSNDGFVNIYHDMEKKVDESERRRVELVEAVRPVVEWWEGRSERYGNGEAIAIMDTVNGNHISVAQITALAALVGEEGK